MSIQYDSGVGSHISMVKLKESSKLLHVSNKFCVTCCLILLSKLVGIEFYGRLAKAKRTLLLVI